MIQINRNPSKRQMRTFAALVFPAFWGLVALLVLLRAEQPRLALTIALAAAIISIIGLVSPRFMRLVYLGMIYVTYPIGFVVSHILLGLVFYVVISGVGLLLRILGKDPMHRDADPKVETYWIRKEHDSSSDHYFRQY